MKTYFKTKDLLETYNQPVQYVKFQGVYGYLILTADNCVVFMYSSEGNIQYDDVTAEFLISK